MAFVVTMQAQKEAPPDMQCKDKFLLQSVVAPDGSTTKDITPEMVRPCCLHMSFRGIGPILDFILLHLTSFVYLFIVQQGGW